jgi:hypothetical protein
MNAALIMIFDVLVAGCMSVMHIYILNQGGVSELRLLFTFRIRENNSNFCARK